MKVFKSLKEVKGIKGSAVTVGVFDGVHLGHKKIFGMAVSAGQRLKVKSCVITFREHPDKHLNKAARLRQIKSLEAKLRRIADCGIEATAALDFSEISGYTAEEFVEKVLVKKFKVRYAVSGRDFVFGRGAAGNVRSLANAGKKYGFETAVAEDFKISGKKISSTLIRKMLEKGRLEDAEKMLGRKYEIEGKVIRGSRMGFEFPTANISLEYEDIPLRGVWAVKVLKDGREYLGAANIGFAPTLKNESAAHLEVYILGFKGNLYGRKIRVVFLGRLRTERRFKNRQALLAQVKKDIQRIKNEYSGQIKSV